MKEGNGRLCRHPESERFHDPESGRVYCRRCGLELGLTRFASASQKFGRGPMNASVFRSNLGSTSKLKKDQKGPEPFHLDAVSSVYGGHGHLGTLIQTKTCPSCHAQQFVRLFNDGGLVCENETCGSLVCGKCSSLKLKGENGKITEDHEGNLCCNFGPTVSEDLVCSKYGQVRKNVQFIRTHLGEYLLRWNPSNNGNGSRISFWADVRSLQAWDPPEDPDLKAARELLREKLLGKVRPEDAHRLASIYLAAVKHALAQQRRDLKKLCAGILDSVLEIEGVTLGNGNNDHREAPELRA